MLSNVRYQIVSVLFKGVKLAHEAKQTVKQFASDIVNGKLIDHHLIVRPEGIYETFKIAKRNEFGRVQDYAERSLDELSGMGGKIVLLMHSSESRSRIVAGAERELLRAGARVISLSINSRSGFIGYRATIPLPIYLNPIPSYVQEGFSVVEPKNVSEAAETHDEAAAGENQ